MFSLVSLVFLQQYQFLTHDRYVSRRFNPHSDLAAVNIHDHDADVVTDEYLLADLSGEY